MVVIATSSAEKAALLQSCLPGARVELVELHEPQADRIEDVALAKAASARAMFGLAVVEDSGLVIPSLGGFPGPYTKYVLRTIGAAGLSKLACGAACEYRSCVAVGERVFVHSIAGTIAEAREGALWELFVPDGERVAFAALPADTQRKHLGRLREAIAASLSEWAR